MATQPQTPAPTPATPSQPSGIEQYLFSVAAKKVSWAIGKFLTAFLSSVAVQAVLTKYGVHVDQAVFVTSATATLMGLLEMALDYAKLKTGWAWL